MKIPLSVDVYCIDGLVGRSITTISNPITKEVTHFVVAELQNPHIKRLVPVELIKTVTPQVIHLNCSAKEFAKTEQLEKFLLHPTNGNITHLVLKMGQVWV